MVPGMMQIEGWEGTRDPGWLRPKRTRQDDRIRALQRDNQVLRESLGEMTARLERLERAGTEA